MRISYVTVYDALDIHNWSGLGYTIANALKDQDVELDLVGNLHASPTAGMYLKKLVNKLQHKKYDFGRNITTAAQYAKQVKSMLTHDTDIIFSPGTIPIALLETNKHKVIYTDATFAGMIGFYDDFTNLSNETLAHGHYLERASLESAKLVVYSSDWAARSAITDYGIDPGKVRVVPFGSNVRSELSSDDVLHMIRNRSASECHLLFCAIDWERKGGNTAMAVARKLNENGLKTTLHIVGIRELPFAETPSYVKSYGFVSKSKPEGMRLIASLLAKSHFLILPAIADCTPVVLSEANAFGIPCLASNTGGIPTIIRENINGKTFGIRGDENSYTDYIERFFDNGYSYAELAASSYQEYDRRLNWKVAGNSLFKMMAEL